MKNQYTLIRQLLWLPILIGQLIQKNNNSYLNKNLNYNADIWQNIRHILRNGFEHNSKVNKKTKIFSLLILRVKQSTPSLVFSTHRHKVTVLRHRKVTEIQNATLIYMYIQRRAEAFT